jgi:hypothetical protein
LISVGKLSSFKLPAELSSSPDKYMIKQEAMKPGIVSLGFLASE